MNGAPPRVPGESMKHRKRLPQNMRRRDAWGTLTHGAPQNMRRPSFYALLMQIFGVVLEIPRHMGLYCFIYK